MAANTKGAKLVDSGDEAGEALRSLHAEQHTRASLLDPSAHSGSLDPLQEARAPRRHPRAITVGAK